MATRLELLIVEDSEDDALLVVNELRRGGFAPRFTRVDTAETLSAALAQGNWDLVISDHSLPSFSSTRALEIVKHHAPDLPFIIVSGTMSEEHAVAAMRAGASDFVVKTNLARLAPAIERELKEAEARRQRRRAEQDLDEAKTRLAFLARLSNDVIWDLDLRTRVTRVSGGLEAVFGYKGLDQTDDGFEWWVARVHPEDRERIEQDLRAVLEGRVDEWFGEFRFRRADGSYAYVVNRAFLVRDEAGHPLRLTGTMFDVTRQHDAEQALLASQEQFRQAQKLEAIGRLAGGVAHDFNNLLTAILGYSEFLLASFPPDDERRADVNEIRNAGERAVDLTRQLLAFSRQQVLELRVLNLNQVVSDVERLLRRVIGEDIELLTVTDPNLGRIKADPTQVEQILMNLAVNARDAMPLGGRLTIETMNVDVHDTGMRPHPVMSPGAYVVLRVSDTGTGIPPDVLPSIFEPFFTTKEPGKGTGLGLSTVYGIVEQNRGYVFPKSELGHGAVFTVYLPRTDEEGEPIVAPAPRPLAARGNETILLVEDDPPVCDLAAKILTGRGYRVLAAATSEEALRLGSESGRIIDLLLTDLVLPGLSGQALAERLMQLRPGLNVLYMSGSTSHAAVMTEQLDPRVRFLQKPFTPTTLLKKVAEVIGD